MSAVSIDEPMIIIGKSQESLQASEGRRGFLVHNRVDFFKVHFNAICTDNIAEVQGFRYGEFAFIRLYEQVSVSQVGQDSSNSFDILL